jgi:dihydropyrimidinase
VLWSEGVEKWRMTPQTLVATCCEMPAKLFGLWPRKGSLDIGSDADLVILDPNQIASVEPARLHMGVDHHPFAAKSLKGWPVGTILRGEVVVENGTPSGTPSGQLCERQFALP